MKHIDIITKRYDQLLLVLIVILCVVGTVMLYSASSSLSLNETGGITDTLFHNNYTGMLNRLTCPRANVLNSKCVIIYIRNNCPNNCETSVAWLYWTS